MEKSFLYLFFFIIFIPLSYSDTWENKADLTLELRQFVDDNNDETFENQRALKLAYQGGRNYSKYEVKLNFSARYDDQDPSRKVIYPEDTFVRYALGPDTLIGGGYKILNFSYMEVFNPLDVANARIFDVSAVEFDKLGELFLGIESYVYKGDFKFFLTPHPTKPILPGKDSRVNLPKNFNKALWLGQDGDEPDWSDHFIMSYEKVFDDFDLMFLFSKGMDRNRLFIGTLDYSRLGSLYIPDSSDVFTPFYFERYFSGVSTVYNFSSFQLKGALAHSYYLAEDEVLNVNSELEVQLKSPKDYSVAVIGFEKSISHSGGIDSTLLAEVQYSFIHEDDEEEFPLQNDLFLAWRVSFNDINSKTLLFSILQDLESSKQEGFTQFKYSQRFSQTWFYEIYFVDYFIPDDASLEGLGLFREKEHVSLKIKKYF